MIDFNITPYKVGDGGILCMPCVKNIPDAGERHPDWKIKRCPVCGDECWESDAHREALRREPDIKSACTMCALKAGIAYGD